MVVPKWRGTGRAKQLHDTLLNIVSADKVGEIQPVEDVPQYSVMVRKLKFTAQDQVSASLKG